MNFIAPQWVIGRCTPAPRCRMAVCSTSGMVGAGLRCAFVCLGSLISSPLRYGVPMFPLWRGTICAYGWHGNATVRSRGAVVSQTRRDVDADLVARVQRGDKRAFDLLVLKYQRRIMRLLARLLRSPADIEDVTQEAFIKAYRALPQFRG